MRIGRERKEVARVIARDGERCVICEFDLPWALAAHHKVPRELGGRDTAANLTTLCSNCHKMVHWFVAGDRLAGPDGLKVRRSLSKIGFARLRELVGTVRTHKLKTREAGHRWIVRPNTRGPMSLGDALDLIGRRNHLDQTFALQQRSVVESAIAALGSDLLNECAVRLVQNGRFMSINAGNICLFRVPGFPDGAKEPQDDFYIIWTRTTKLSPLSAAEWRKISRWRGFARLPHAFDLDISLEEALAMTPADWGTFRDVSREAVAAAGTRRWVSNIAVASEDQRGLTRHAPVAAVIRERRG